VLNVGVRRTKVERDDGVDVNSPAGPNSATTIAWPFEGLGMTTLLAIISEPPLLGVAPESPPAAAVVSSADRLDVAELVVDFVVVVVVELATELDVA